MAPLHPPQPGRHRHGEAGALIEFTGDNSVLVAYQGLTEGRLASQHMLAAEMVSRYWAGTWPKGWCVVSHLVMAEHGTVLVGGEKGSTVDWPPRPPSVPPRTRSPTWRRR